MVHVERTMEDALLLGRRSRVGRAINTVLVMKGVRVDELRKQSTAERLVA